MAYVVQQRHSLPTEQGHYTFDQKKDALKFAREICGQFECYVWDTDKKRFVLKLYKMYTRTPIWV